MRPSENFDPKKTKKLFGLDKKFYFFKNLIITEKLPKVILLSGKKGSGKSTLIFHLMHSIFNKENYCEEKKMINSENALYYQLNSNIHPNVIYLNGNNFINTKIEDIRNLKNKLFKAPINRNKRFIILDDVEAFNTNSLNALLKIIEEPGDYNYFILINNQSKPILETIKSRCIDIKFILKKADRDNIIASLLNFFKQKLVLNDETIQISPGNFLKYNWFVSEKNLDIGQNFLSNLNVLLNMYKKDKDNFYKEFLLFYSEFYLTKMKSKKNYLENKSFLTKNINEFFLYNLNQNSLLRSLERKFKYE